jgi:polyferredoxin
MWLNPEDAEMKENTARHFLSLPKIRPYVQGFFLIFFILLFLKISYPLQEHITKNFFFNLDPLIVLAIALSGSVVITALFISIITVIVTVLFGRVFCGWVCPMGTLFDLFSYIIPLKKSRPPAGFGRFKNIKYYLLGFLLFGSVSGFSAALFFDPLVFLFRVFTLNLYPFAVLVVNLVLNIFRPLALKMGAMNLYMLSLDQPVFNIFGFVNLLLFLLTVGLIYTERRFWCRNLCPLGALLSLLSRFSLWGRRVSDDMPSGKNSAKHRCVSASSASGVKQSVLSTRFRSDSASLNNSASNSTHPAAVLSSRQSAVSSQVLPPELPQQQKPPAALCSALPALSWKGIFSIPA